VAARPDSDWVRALLAAAAGRRIVLVTTHRRENFGDPLADICRALRDMARRVPDLQFVVPVHRNPNVAGVVQEALEDDPAFTLTPPLDYPDFVGVMKHAVLILTDSGGVQEEAPSLGVPVLVLRERSERQEAIDAGTARLVGTNPSLIVDVASRLLTDETERLKMTGARNPFGDGHASERIVTALRERPAARA
jgi:UDP-N-acetylglucosamine 2-epimerase (non-hydrolysing)